jgi:dienelactone hydrolase
VETQEDTRTGPRRLVALLLALVAGVTGVAGLVTAGQGIEQRSAVVSGVPLEVARPSHGPARVPGVVVAHGLGASRQLMRGFGDTLTRHGYAVELVDLAGHGANTEPLPDSGDGPAAEERLDHDLDVAVAHLRALPGVDGTRIGLIGHSMGAAAVLRYALAHPAIRATVSISQGETSLAGVRPRNLLLLAGGLEFPAYRDGALGALRAAYPEGRAGTTYGDPRAGTARRAVIVPGVEHVGVLFQPCTHREILSWFHGSLGGSGGRSVGVRPLWRAGSAVLIYLAAMLSFGALAALVLGRSPGGSRRAAPFPLVLGFPAVAVLVAIPAMAVVPEHLLPIAVAAAVAGFFAVAGAVMLTAGLLTGGRADSRGGARAWTAAVVLVALTAVSFAVPAQLGWAHAVPTGPRAWTLLPIAACGALFFAGAETLCAGHGRGTAILIHAWTATSALAGLGVAALVGAASSFVLLVAPLLAGLLVWQGVQAAALRGLRAPVWLAAALGGVLLAWPIAITMPLVTGG